MASPSRKKTGLETQEISVINMKNYKICKVIDGFDKLISSSITDNERKQFWKGALLHYRKFIEIMRKKGNNYTQEELATYEGHADDFFPGMAGSTW